MIRCYYLLGLMLVAGQAVADIPLPELTPQGVIDVAEQHLINDRSLMDMDDAKPEDYLLLKLEYRTLGQGSHWVWVVKFVHPEYKSHGVTYMIDNQGGISTLQSIE